MGVSIQPQIAKKKIPAIGGMVPYQGQEANTLTQFPGVKPVTAPSVPDPNGTTPPVSGVAPRPVNTPGVGVTPINPAQDTRGANITPAPSARYAGAQQRTDQQANRIQNTNRPAAIGAYGQQFNAALATPAVQMGGVQTDVSRGPVNTTLNAGPAVNPMDTADLAKFRDMRSGAADKLTSGMSRSDIAKQQLEAFDMKNSQGAMDLQRQIIQRSGAAGRLGMGDDMVASLRPFTDLMTQRAALEKELAAETAAGEISDRYNLLDASRGLVGEEEGIASGRRGEQRTERDYRTSIDDINIGRGIEETDKGTALTERNLDRRASERDTRLGLDERNTGRDFDARRAALEMATGVSGQDQAFDLSTFGALSGYEQGIGDDEQGYRDEYRGERDYEQLLARQAMQDQIDQQNREFGREGELWNRDFAEDTLAAGMNPAGTYLGAANQYGAGASGAYGNAGDLFAQWLARQKR